MDPKARKLIANIDAGCKCFHLILDDGDLVVSKGMLLNVKQNIEKLIGILGEPHMLLIEPKYKVFLIYYRYFLAKKSFAKAIRNGVLALDYQRRCQTFEVCDWIDLALKVTHICMDNSYFRQSSYLLQSIQKTLENEELHPDQGEYLEMKWATMIDVVIHKLLLVRQFAEERTRMLPDYSVHLELVRFKDFDVGEEIKYMGILPTTDFGAKILLEQSKRRLKALASVNMCCLGVGENYAFGRFLVGEIQELFNRKKEKV